MLVYEWPGLRKKNLYIVHTICLFFSYVFLVEIHPVLGEALIVRVYLCALQINIVLQMSRQNVHTL